MKIKQISSGCIAHLSYYIESAGEVAVIDPSLDIQSYLEMARKDSAKIKYVFETHFHADFVSGHQELSAVSGASIVFGPTTMMMGYDAIIAEDGQVFTIGQAKIKCIHTPGHTPESTCYLLINEEGKGEAIFTGDTLLLGDVAAPDLPPKILPENSRENLSEQLYYSLRKKIRPLPDDLRVYPAHCAGEAKGESRFKEISDTLGNQQKTNHVLRMSKTAFIQQITSKISTPPAYFHHNQMVNILGFDKINNPSTIWEKGLNPDEFEEAAKKIGVLVLDTRDCEDFAKGFIPKSINIGIDGRFAIWLGTLVPDMKREILVVAEVGKEKEVLSRLAKIGYKNTLGFLQGGFKAWKSSDRKVDTLPTITAEALIALREKGNEIHILDVRKASEHVSEHILGAENAPLDCIKESLPRLKKNITYYVHCGGGFRSMIFNSILKIKGFNNLVYVKGGYEALKASGKFPVSDYVFPDTLL